MPVEILEDVEHRLHRGTGDEHGARPIVNNAAGNPPILVCIQAFNNDFAFSSLLQILVVFIK